MVSRNYAILLVSFLRMLVKKEKMLTATVEKKFNICRNITLGQ